MHKLFYDLISLQYASVNINNNQVLENHLSTLNEMMRYTNKKMGM